MEKILAKMEKVRVEKKVVKMEKIIVLIVTILRFTSGELRHASAPPVKHPIMN